MITLIHALLFIITSGSLTKGVWSPERTSFASYITLTSTLLVASFNVTVLQHYFI